jgi:hypothetical protein
MITIIKMEGNDFFLREWSPEMCVVPNKKTNAIFIFNIRNSPFTETSIFKCDTKKLMPTKILSLPSVSQITAVATDYSCHLVYGVVNAGTYRLLVLNFKNIVAENGIVREKYGAEFQTRINVIYYHRNRWWLGLDNGDIYFGKSPFGEIFKVNILQGIFSRIQAIEPSSDGEMILFGGDSVLAAAQSAQYIYAQDTWVFGQPISTASRIITIKSLSPKSYVASFENGAATFYTSSDGLRWKQSSTTQQSGDFDNSSRNVSIATNKFKKIFIQTTVKSNSDYASVFVVRNDMPGFPVQQSIIMDANFASETDEIGIFFFGSEKWILAYENTTNQVTLAMSNDNGAKFTPFWKQDNTQLREICSAISIIGV